MRKECIVRIRHINTVTRELGCIYRKRGKRIGAEHRNVYCEYVKITGLILFLYGVDVVIDLLGVLQVGFTNGSERLKLYRKAEALPNALYVLCNSGLRIVLTIAYGKASLLYACLCKQGLCTFNIRSGLERIALYLAEGLAARCVVYGVCHEAGCGICIYEQLCNRFTVKRHGKRTAYTCIAEELVFGIEHIRIGGVCIGHVRLLCKLCTVCERNVTHILQIACGILSIDRIQVVCVGSLTGGLILFLEEGNQDSVRLYVAVQHILFGIAVIVVIALDTHRILVAVDRLDDHRTVGDQRCVSARPISAVVGNRLLAKRYKRKACQILLEVFVIDLALKGDLQKICIQCNDTQIVDRSIARLNDTCILHIVQQCCSRALVGTLHQALPCINKVVCSQSATVRPLGLADRDLHLVFALCLVLQDRDVLGKCLYGIALLIQTEQALKDKTEDLDGRSIGQILTGVKRIDIIGDICVKNIALILVLQADAAAAGSQSRRNNDQTQKKRQNSFHSGSPPKFILQKVCINLLV